MNPPAAVRGLAGRVWYGEHWLGVLLLPLSAVYRAGLGVRRLARRLRPAKPLGIPVIVVGNLTVGGTGKTPLVIHLAGLLQSRGHRVGIVSRGYRARVARFPHSVGEDDDASAVGDEPKLIAQETGCPVVIAPRRREAALHLMENFGVDLVLSDDGLQHSALPRALEIIVVDGDRKFGNGRLLPAGPLREPVSRLDGADYVVVNNASPAGTPAKAGVRSNRMTVHPCAFRHLPSGRREPADYFNGQPIHACAGIGNPQRFFNALISLGIEVRPHEFPDHHTYHPGDLLFDDGLAVVMTAKDGVKCAAFAHSGAEALQNVWIAEAETRLDADFEKELLNRIEALIHG